MQEVLLLYIERNDEDNLFESYCHKKHHTSSTYYCGL